jgi:hypothetical protein
MDMQNSILAHFGVVWERQRGTDTRKVLNDFPLPLRLDMAYCMNYDALVKIKRLRECSIDVQKWLALYIKACVFSKGDFIYKTGDLGYDVYFIKVDLLIPRV